MHPILFSIPLPGWELPIVGKVDAIPIYSYGVMLGLSLVVGWYLTLGLAEKDGLGRERMANNYVITAIAAVVMSRVLYVITNLGEFDSFADVFSMRRGGLVAYGGFIGGYLGSWWYLRRKGMRLMPWADVAVPSLASGLAITRIGCYLFGCDYGRPLADNAPGWLKKMGSFPHWAEGTLPSGSGAPAWVEHVRTRGLDPTAEYSLPVHPTQIYESLVGLMLLGLLLWARKRQTFRGQIFFVFTFAYGFARFLLELLRDDPERGNMPGALPEHILVPLCLAVFAAGYAFSFARLVETPGLRRVTQVLAFVPAVAAAALLRPETFAGDTLMQLSTSQFIGVSTGLAVCVAYVLFDNAARAHPDTAMEVFLEGHAPEEPKKKRKKRAAEAGEDEADAADDAPAEAAEPRKRTKKKASKKKARSKAKAPPESESETESVKHGE